MTPNKRNQKVEFELKETIRRISAYIDANPETKDTNYRLKPFFKFPLFRFKVKRAKYNPMRLLLGDYYYSSDPMKMDLDVKDIKIK